jgi:16S rRNA (guanine527-N7)-methyltransferase
LVVSRALGRLPAAAEMTIPFSAIGGLTVAMKKGDISEEVLSASRAIKLMGGRLIGIRKVDLEGLCDNRVLVEIEKLTTTPITYPRRTGMPTHQPILDTGPGK